MGTRDAPRHSQRVDAASSGAGAPTHRHRLVVVLTFVTGCADAMGFLALGGAFSSVMTGNMVLLGLSAGRLDGALATTSGAAILSYVVGVIVGARVAGRRGAGDPVWPSRVNGALGLELLVLVGFVVGWELTLGHRDSRAETGLLMISATAMGIQSSAVQRFGVPGLSSTYLTGTLTSFIAALAMRHPPRAMLPHAQSLLALMTGAAVGALVTHHLPRWSPVLLVVPLCAVLALSLPLTRAVASDQG